MRPKLTVEWLDEATADRIGQLTYIAGESPRAALRIDAQIDHQMDLLSTSPRMGRAGRQPGTRELVISRSPFILVYRVAGKRIEILRLIHGRQQWPFKPGSRKSFASLEEED